MIIVDNSTNHKSSADELLTTTEDMELEKTASTQPMKEEEKLLIVQSDEID